MSLGKRFRDLLKKGDSDSSKRPDAASPQPQEENESSHSPAESRSPSVRKKVNTWTLRGDVKVSELTGASQSESTAPSQKPSPRPLDILNSMRSDVPPEPAIKTTDDPLKHINPTMPIPKDLVPMPSSVPPAPAHRPKTVVMPQSMKPAGAPKPRPKTVVMPQEMVPSASAEPSIPAIGTTSTPSTPPSIPPSPKESILESPPTPEEMVPYTPPIDPVSVSPFDDSWLDTDPFTPSNTPFPSDPPKPGEVAPFPSDPPSATVEDCDVSTPEPIDFPNEKQVDSTNVSHEPLPQESPPISGIANPPVTPERKKDATSISEEQTVEEDKTVNEIKTVPPAQPPKETETKSLEPSIKQPSEPSIKQPSAPKAPEMVSPPASAVSEKTKADQKPIAPLGQPKQPLDSPSNIKKTGRSPSTGIKSEPAPLLKPKRARGMSGGAKPLKSKGLTFGKRH